MKSLLYLLSFFAVFFLVFVDGVSAMEITKIGATDVTGKGIGSTVSAYTYPLRSFTLYGTANASSSVAVKIDDVTYSATANSIGDWSTYLSNLTYSAHTVTISSASQSSLNFTLTISSTSATTTPTSTPTATVTSSGSSLPASGTVENTFLSAALALFLIGLGVAVKYKD